MADFNWSFKEETGFEKIPNGDYRLKIKEAEKAISQSGNDMLVLTLNVSGFEKTIKNYIVFLKDKPEITNRNLTSFFASFGIENGNFNIKSYVGKVGAGHIETPEGEEYEKVKYFLNGKKKDELPKFVVPNRKKVTVSEMEKIDTNDLPF